MLNNSRPKIASTRHKIISPSNRLSLINRILMCFKIVKSLMLSFKNLQNSNSHKAKTLTHQSLSWRQFAKRTKHRPFRTKTKMIHHFREFSKKTPDKAVVNWRLGRNPGTTSKAIPAQAKVQPPSHPTNKDSSKTRMPHKRRIMIMMMQGQEQSLAKKLHKQPIWSSKFAI